MYRRCGCAPGWPGYHHQEEICMKMNLHLAVMVSTLLLSACGSDDGGDVDDATEAPSASGAPSTPEAAAGGNAFVLENLTITGGEYAGTYTASAASAACSYGIAGADTWGIQFSESDQNPGSIQAIIPDVPREGGQTSTFNLGVQPRGMRGHMTIDTRGSGFPERGSGTVTIEGGTPATISIRGTTAEDAQIEAEIRCNQVIGG
jgi:hypothetical protein